MSTKAKLEAENAELTAKVAELEEAGSVADLMVEVEVEKDRADRYEVSLPERIAEWLAIVNNHIVSPKDIFITDVNESKVTYRFAGSEDTFGITRTETGDMVKPTPHEHSYRDRDNEGLPAICRCGETD